MGDVLYFEFDSTINKLAITKNNSSERYEMDIEKRKAEKYTVCAYLMGSEDSV